MAQTRGPVHLSLEDKTSQRKEWPEGDFSEIPPGLCGSDSCTWRAERSRSTTSRSPDVLHWVGLNFLFPPDLFPKYLSDTFVSKPYSCLLLFFPLSLFSLLNFVLLIPLASSTISSFCSSYFSYTWNPFIFFQFSRELSHTAGPICLS